MTNNDIIKYLGNKCHVPIAEAETSELMISSKVIRCKNKDALVAGMGSNHSKDDQIHLFVDAVHLNLQEYKKGRLELYLGRRNEDNEQKELENAAALLLKSLNLKGLKVEVFFDTQKEMLKCGDYGRDRKWLDAISKKRGLPELGKKIATQVNDDYFRWYRSVTGNYWSGRVGGLEVCDMGLRGKKITLNVGGAGKGDKDKTPRDIFADILVKENLLKLAKDLPEKGLPFGSSEPEIKKVVSAICALVQSRKNGDLEDVQREHLLESQVLAGNLKVCVEAGELTPVCDGNPFQFPTLWSADGKPRFVDALMKIGNIPYAVELKYSKTSSAGQYYRHGITQAVLYQEFIRREKRVHKWFEDLGLEPTKCKAVLAFPKMSQKDKDRRDKLYGQLVSAGKAFGVKVIEIEGF